MPGDLQAWEQRRAAAEAEAPGAASSQAPAQPACQAVACWSRIDRRTRQAMKRAGPGVLLALECSLLDPLLEASLVCRSLLRIAIGVTI